jgi:hypothetical protein
VRRRVLAQREAMLDRPHKPPGLSRRQASARKGSAVWVAKGRTAMGAPAERGRALILPAPDAPPTEAVAREGPLPPSPGRSDAASFRRFYEPATIRVMTDALDLACRLLPPGVRDSESLRRRVALHIIHHLDAGERDAMRLATAAVFWVRV